MVKKKSVLIGLFAFAAILVISVVFNSGNGNDRFGSIKFPEDEWPHDELIEWYYWVGHLKTETGRWFGYELVFFLFDMGGRRMQVVNHAVTDIQNGKFVYTIDTSYGPVPEQGEPLLFEAENFSAHLENGKDTIHGEVDDFILDLHMETTMMPVLHHGDGYTDYSFGGYTYYYSRTRMETSGSISINGQPHPVTGVSWFDHQWGGLSKISDLGWDWFAIQLDDGREIMLFYVHTTKGEFLVGGSFIKDNGYVAEIHPESSSVTALGEWISPNTGKRYPSGWDIRIFDIQLTVTPVLADQELVFEEFNIYWEGACVVEGDAAGRAYVELFGY